MTFEDCFEMGVDFMGVPGEIYQISAYKQAKKWGFPAFVNIVDAMTGEKLGYVEPDYIEELEKKLAAG